MVLAVQVFHRVAVANHIAAEAEIVPQALCKPVSASLHGDSVIVVVGAHHSQDSGPADYLPPRVHVDVFHFVRSHLRVHPGHALASALVVGIGAVVLCRCRHLPVRLHAGSHLHAEFGHQIGRFSIDFFVAAPSLVAAHVEDGRIDIGVAEQPSFPSGDVADLPHEFAVPAVTDSQLCGEVGSAVCFHAADALVRKVRGNSEPGFFHEEALHDIQRPCMLGSRPEPFAFGYREVPVAETVKMFVYRPDAVFPYLFLPCGSGEFILQHSFVAVEGNHLTGFLLQVHLREQVLYSCVDIGGSVFIDILDPVLVEIYPAFVVDASLPEFLVSGGTLPHGESAACERGAYQNKAFHFFTAYEYPSTWFQAPRVKSGTSTGMLPCSMERRLSSVRQLHSAAS